MRDLLLKLNVLHPLLIPQAIKAHFLPRIRCYDACSHIFKSELKSWPRHFSRFPCIISRDRGPSNNASKIAPVGGRRFQIISWLQFWCKTKKRTSSPLLTFALSLRSSVFFRIHNFVKESEILGSVRLGTYVRAAVRTYSYTTQSKCSGDSWEFSTISCSSWILFSTFMRPLLPCISMPFWWAWMDFIVRFSWRVI